jgi:hypothetical protein
MPEWVLDWLVFSTVLGGLYFYQRSRWGIRIMTRQSMRKEMEKEIADKLWDKWTEGKISLKEYTRVSNYLADLFDFPDLRSIKRSKFKLKAEITRRIKALKRTPKPKIPGEKPIQDISKPIIKPTKVTHIKFNAA